MWQQTQNAAAVSELTTFTTNIYTQLLINDFEKIK